MARLPHSADVRQIALANNVAITRTRETGAEGEALQRVGQATHELATRIREQQIDQQVLEADSHAQKMLDARFQELRTRDDWEAFGPDMEEAARGVMEATRPKNAGLRGAQAWQAQTERRVNDTRQRGETFGLQRGTELAVAGVEAMRSQALGVLQDDAASLEAIRDAVAKAMTAAATARARGFMGADDVERMRGALENAAGERQRRVQRETRVVELTDQAAGKGELGERMAWVAANVPAYLRDAVEDRVAQAWQRQRAATETQQETDRDAYMRHENGGSRPAPDVMARIESEQPEFLQQRAERRRALFREGVSNMAAARQLQAMQSKDLADSFIAGALTDPARMNALLGATPQQLGAIAGRLEPDDMLRIGQFRAQQLGRAEADPQVTLIEKVYRDLLSAGMPLAEARVRGFGTQRDGENHKAKFESYTYGVARDFVVRYGRAPTQADMDLLINRALEEESAGGIKFRYGRGWSVLPTTPEEQKPR